MKELKLLNTIILVGAGVCSVICISILGGVVEHALDKVA